MKDKINKIKDKDITLAQALQIVEKCGLWYFISEYTNGTGTPEKAMNDITG